MKSNTRILKFVAIAALVAGSVSVASAAGLLGQRYASGTFDWMLPDDNAVSDGHGFTATLNQPLSSNIDLSVNYDYLDAAVDFDTGEGIVESDLSRQRLLFGATFFAPVQAAKVYGRVSAGWHRVNVGGEDDNDGLYILEAGAEFAAGAKATLTPFISWENTFDDDLGDNGVFNYGALAEFALADKWSALAKVSLDDDDNWYMSAGIAFRF